MAEIPQSLDLLPIVRMPGVEPGSQAWEACMMPLHYMRHTSEVTMNCIRYILFMELGVQICKNIGGMSKRTRRLGFEFFMISELWAMMFLDLGLSQDMFQLDWKFLLRFSQAGLSTKWVRHSEIHFTTSCARSNRPAACAREKVSCVRSRQVCARHLCILQVQA